MIGKIIDKLVQRYKKELKKQRKNTLKLMFKYYGGLNSINLSGYIEDIDKLKEGLEKMISKSFYYEYGVSKDFKEMANEIVNYLFSASSKYENNLKDLNSMEFLVEQYNLLNDIKDPKKVIYKTIAYLEETPPIDNHIDVISLPKYSKFVAYRAKTQERINVEDLIKKIFNENIVEAKRNNNLINDMIKNDNSLITLIYNTLNGVHVKRDINERVLVIWDLNKAKDKVWYVNYIHNIKNNSLRELRRDVNDYFKQLYDNVDIDIKYFLLRL